MERDIRVQIIPGPFGLWRRCVEYPNGITTHWEAISDEFGKGENWFAVEDSGVRYRKTGLHHQIDLAPVENTRWL